MNNIFQYLYDKKGKPIPLLFKLINKLPLNESNLYFDGNLYLQYSNITSLPNNLTINGNLNISDTNITTLPNNLTVNGSLNLSHTDISELPDDLCVYGNLYCWCTPLAKNIKKDISLLNDYEKLIKGKICFL